MESSHKQLDRQLAQITNSLLKSLAEAKLEFPAFDKKGKNPHFKSDFITLGQIQSSVTSILAKHKLVITQHVGENACTTILNHFETGESLECSIPLIISKNDMQGLGSAITYARRYGLMTLLGIAEWIEPPPAKEGEPGYDDDGNENSLQQKTGVYRVNVEGSSHNGKTLDEVGSEGIVKALDHWKTRFAGSKDKPTGNVKEFMEEAEKWLAETGRKTLNTQLKQDGRGLTPPPLKK